MTIVSITFAGYVVWILT